MNRPPLDGIRVADFCWAWAGPYGALHLAHLGAEVIRIESNTRMCPTRNIPPWPNNERGINRSGYFNQYNQGKRSLNLDLKKPDGIALAKQLIAKSDIVIENYAAGVMDKMGLGYEVLRTIKPNIIMIALSGYGATGPEKGYVSYGPPQVALSGMASLTGYRGGDPAQAGFSYGDPNGGIHGTFSVMCALLHRARTGEGQFIDLSQREACAMLLPEGLMDYAMNGTEPPRQGNRDTWMSPHNCFRCLGEDTWVTIACGTEEEWQALCRVMGHEDMIDDPRFRTMSDRKAHEDTLEQLITTWTTQRDRWEITRSLQAVRVAAFPSMSSKDLVEDAHLNERGFFARLPHPRVGTQTHTGIPWILTNSPNGVRSPAPLLGQHTDAVLRDVLGYADEDIARLREQQVLY